MSNTSAAAAVSYLITAVADFYGETVLKNDPQLRKDAREFVEQFVSSYKIDRDDWAFTKSMFQYYDDYLHARQKAGSLTDFDLTRAGLTRGNFQDSRQYAEHMRRVGEAAAVNGDEAMKTCSRCLETKPRRAFRASGAVCNSCRSRAYRQRGKE